MSFKVPEQYRVLAGSFATSAEVEGNNGMFLIGTATIIIATDQGGWEHVSVSLQRVARCPTWEEMCAVKAMFWDPEDAVAQFHPPASAHVNYHPYCLHLWREVGQEFVLPPSWMVGPKERTREAVAQALSEARMREAKVADADTKALYVKQFGSERGWLEAEGSYFIEGVRAGRGAA